MSFMAILRISDFSGTSLSARCRGIADMDQRSQESQESGALHRYGALAVKIAGPNMASAPRIQRRK
jgi:hypothetical protein